MQSVAWGLNLPCFILTFHFCTCANIICVVEVSIYTTCSNFHNFTSWYIPKSHPGSICTYGQGTKNTFSQYYLHSITYSFNKKYTFHINLIEMKWNESGFRPPLCTYRLNWAKRTSWGWRDDWDDTVLQTQDSKFEPWRSEADHATSRSRRLPIIFTFTRGWGRNIFVSFKPPRTGNRTPNCERQRC